VTVAFEMVGQAGAVYIPVEEIDPYVELPLATPFTDHFTEVFDVPDTEAVNCCDLPPCTVAVPGLTETFTDEEAAIISTLELADLVGSAMLCAVTETEPPEGTLAGAVYMPEVEIVPTVELPPVVPFTFQVADVLDENCCLPLTCKAALVGLTEMLVDPPEPTVKLREDL